MMPIKVDRALLRRVVSDKVPEPWRRASLVLPGSDGDCTYDFFMEKTEGERVELLENFFKNGAPWSPLIVKEIPKGARWSEVAAEARLGRSPRKTTKTRIISHDTRIDHGAQLVLLEPSWRRVQKRHARQRHRFCSKRRPLRPPHKHHRQDSRRALQVQVR